MATRAKNQTPFQMVTYRKVTTEIDLKPSTIEKEGTQQDQLQETKSTAKGIINSKKQTQQPSWGSSRRGQLGNGA